MKKLFKTMLVFVLAVFMTFSLVACGPKDDPQGNGGNENNVVNDGGNGNGNENGNGNGDNGNGNGNGNGGTVINSEFFAQEIKQTVNSVDMTKGYTLNGRFTLRTMIPDIDCDIEGNVKEDVDGGTATIVIKDAYIYVDEETGLHAYAEINADILENKENAEEEHEVALLYIENGIFYTGNYEVNNETGEKELVWHAEYLYEMVPQPALEPAVKMMDAELNNGEDEEEGEGFDVMKVVDAAVATIADYEDFLTNLASKVVFKLVKINLTETTVTVSAEEDFKPMVTKILTDIENCYNNDVTLKVAIDTLAKDALGVENFVDTVLTEVENIIYVETADEKTGDTVIVSNTIGGVIEYVNTKLPALGINKTVKQLVDELGGKFMTHYNGVEFEGSLYDMYIQPMEEMPLETIYESLVAGEPEEEEEFEAGSPRLVDYEEDEEEEEGPNYPPFTTLTAMAKLMLDQFKFSMIAESMFDTYITTEYDNEGHKISSTLSFPKVEELGYKFDLVTSLTGDLKQVNAKVDVKVTDLIGGYYDYNEYEYKEAKIENPLEIHINGGISIDYIADKTTLKTFDTAELPMPKSHLK